MTLSIDQLVTRRIREWEERRRRQEARRGQAAERQRPMITVSRAHGAGGETLARAAARVLGLPVYDRQIVEHIAREANVREQVVATLDARVRDIIDAQVGGAFESGYFTYSDYLRHLSSLVLTLARQESAVIVGRGANFILDPNRTLRVRVTAPLPDRVRCVAEEMGLPAKEARAEVMRVDAERSAYIRWHFNKDGACADHYDLVLNSASLGLDLGAELVATAFRQRFGGPERAERGAGTEASP